MSRFKVFATVLAVVVGLLTITTPSQAAPVYDVTGTVTNGAGRTLVGGAVALLTSCEDDAESYNGYIDESSLLIEEIPAGTYWAQIVADPGFGSIATSWNGGVAHCDDSTQVTVDAVSTTLDLTATAGIDVSGDVARTGGLPVSMGVLNFFADCSDARWTSRHFVASASFSYSSTEPDYTITVPVGKYKVMINPDLDTGAVNSWHNGKATCAKADTVQIGAATTKLNLRALSGWQVHGTTHLPGGEDAENFFVQFYASCEDYADDQSPVAEGGSGYDFDVVLPTGKYWVRMLSASPAYDNSWRDQQRTCAASQPITVDHDIGSLPLTMIRAVRVSGSVTSTSGLPVPSGRVSFYDDCKAYHDGDLTAKSSFESGTYAADVPAGNYKVRVEPDSSAVTSWHDGKPSCDQAPSVTVTDPPNHTVQVPLVALAGSALTGNVTNTAGLLVATGSVTFYQSCAAYVEDLPSAQAEIVDHEYAVNLVDGTYRVLITAEAGQPAIHSWHTGKDACEDSPAITVSGLGSVTLTATPASRVSGLVRVGGQVVSSGTVAFFASCADWGDFGPAAMDWFAGGPYVVSVPDGTYRVMVVAGAESWHKVKQSCADADVVTVGGTTVADVEGQSFAIVRGPVTSARGPVARGHVYYYRSCDDYAADREAAMSRIEDGAYRLKVTAGTYRVRIIPSEGSGALPSWNGAAADCGGSQPVQVVASGKYPVLVVAGYVLSGDITWGSRLTADGQVDFYRDCADGEPVVSSWFEDGAYEVALPQGSYHVRIEMVRGDSFAYSWHSGAPTCAQGTAVQVNADGSADLAARSASRITGAVTVGGQEVPDGNVAFYSSCSEFQSGRGAAFAHLAHGSYAAYLPDGSYLARIDPDAAPPVSWHNGQAGCGTATPVTVSGAGTHDLVGAAGVPVVGKVSSSNGPVTSGTVYFYRTCADFAADEEANGARIESGSYTVSLLPDTYRVYAAPSRSSSALRSWHSAKATCADVTLVTVTGATSQDIVLLGKAISPPPVTPPPVTPPPVTPPVSPPPPVTPPPVTPPVSPPPPTAPATSLAAQTVKAPSAKLKKGKKAKLPGATAQGQKLTWKSTTPKVCKVRKNVVTAKKKGKCKVSASAPAATAYLPFSAKYTIRVR